MDGLPFLSQVLSSKSTTNGMLIFRVSAMGN